MNDSDMLKNLAKKLKKETSILTDEEVEYIVSQTEIFMGPEFVETTKDYDIRMGDIVRWFSLRARCEAERERRGLTFKDVSTQLKIPQYRLRAVEEGTFRELKPEFAHRYFCYLGIESWVRRWARQNAELARRAGITPFPRYRQNDR